MSTRWPSPRRDRPITLLVALLLAPLAVAQDADTNRPNVIIILADDLGYGDLGCYNPASKIPTPNLDRFAREGVRFTDAHAAASICTPSRYGLLTGRYPWRDGLKEGVMGNVPIWGKPFIARDLPTLPSVLRQQGYATACIGKWHLGWEWPTKDGEPPTTKPDNLGNVDFTRAIAAGPTTRGFDYYFGTCVPNYPPYCFIENDRAVGLPTEPSDEFEFPGPKVSGWKQGDILPELTRRAVRSIEDAAGSGQPFFLYFALTSPHHPVVPAADFRGKSGAGLYGDFVVQTDWTVGRVLDALERTRLADDTLVFFTSDNGPEVTRANENIMPVGAYDRIRTYGHSSMGPLRGVKYDAWEGGHRVPFMARWPGQIPPGYVSGELLCLTDLMATCATVAGTQLPPNAGVDSFNALPALRGGRGRRDNAVLQSARPALAVRQGEWVFITGRGGRSEEPDWFMRERGYMPDDLPDQLYRLTDDLSQRRNLAAAEPEKAIALKALLEKLQKDGRSTPP